MDDTCGLSVLLRNRRVEEYLDEVDEGNTRDVVCRGCIYGDG